MAKKIKYQFGGNDTDFFNQLVDTYTNKYNQQQQSSDNQIVELDPEDVQQQDDGSTDYQDLMDKYNDLQGQFTNLSNKFTSSQAGEAFQSDNFLNFLFSDEDKNPVDFSNELYGGGGGGKNSAGLAGYKNKGFQTFGSYQQGRNALENQLELYKSGRTKQGLNGSSTLLEAMSKYAPSSDNNNPTHYAQFIADKLGISPNTPISQVDTKGWADAIETMEGNKYGNNPGNLRYVYGGKIDPNEQIFRYHFGGTPTVSSDDDINDGLNNPEYAKFGSLHMMLPKAFNPVRGLDNNHPVHVKDELGHSSVLVGKHDKKFFFGNVKEQML